MRNSGYKLIEQLRNEANEVAVEHRAELMRDAASEIESLIVQWRELSDKLERINRTSIKETFHGNVERFQEWLDGFTKPEGK